MGRRPKRGSHRPADACAPRAPGARTASHRRCRRRVTRRRIVHTPCHRRTSTARLSGRFRGPRCSGFWRRCLSATHGMRCTPKWRYGLVSRLKPRDRARVRSESRCAPVRPQAARTSTIRRGSWQRAFGCLGARCAFLRILASRRELALICHPYFTCNFNWLGRLLSILEQCFFSDCGLSA